MITGKDSLGMALTDVSFLLVGCWVGTLQRGARPRTSPPLQQRCRRQVQPCCTECKPKLSMPLHAPSSSPRAAHASACRRLVAVAVATVSACCAAAAGMQFKLEPCTILQPHIHPHSEFAFPIEGEAGLSPALRPAEHLKG